VACFWRSLSRPSRFFLFNSVASACTLLEQRGSSFTQEPLGCLLQYDRLTQFNNLITQGKQVCTLHNFDEPTKAILANLCQKTPAATPNSHTLNYEMLLQGIKKWPECTTTSPSGCHLGIYKMLAKHVVKKKNNQTNTPDAPDDESSSLKQGHNVLYLIFDMMNLAITHTYPLQ